MNAARNVVVAGAGIGGLTAALALATKGFRVTVLEQAGRLEETGAGIQLSPNATRVLIDLGLGARLKPHVVAPEALEVHAAHTGRAIVAMPLGKSVEERFGAPYWAIHRGDLQAALVAAVSGHLSIVLKPARRVDGFAADSDGVTVAARVGEETVLERSNALVGADGLWSVLRARLGDATPPRFRRRVAWRALVPADAVAPEWRAPTIRLWLGAGAHLVHYPVKGGAMVNIVAIVDDDRERQGWSAAGERSEIVERFARAQWAGAARDLVGLPERWLTWALYDRAPFAGGGREAVTLLGDAAHPMLPFLAQGAAMAVEDAAVLADCLARTPDNPAGGMRRYETLRHARNAQAVRAARRIGAIYQLPGPASLARNVALRALGGKGLLARQSWLYDWRAPRGDAAANQE